MYQYVARPRAASAVRQPEPQKAAAPAARTTALPHALSRIDVIQLVTVYGAAKITGDYHASLVDARKAVFKAVRDALAPFASRLNLMTQRLTDFMAEIEIAPAADNPLLARSAEVNQFRLDLATGNPTLTKWPNYKMREAALFGLNDETIAGQGYAHARVAILAQLRKLRKQTVGQREYILGQLGADESWMSNAQKQAVATLRTIETDVDALFTEAENAADWTDYESLPATLTQKQAEAAAATDGPFHDQLAGGWLTEAPEVPKPREATNYYQAHILDRHRQSSTALDAGKFLWNDWGTIKTRIDTALGTGNLAGPIFNQAGGQPQGRFEITHVTGAPIGTKINGGNTNTIKLIISKTGKTVITAFPL